MPSQTRTSGLAAEVTALCVWHGTCVIAGMECIGADRACAVNGAGPPAAPASDAPQISFHDVLSALNPLQYVPVVGSIYRAATGDVPPEPVRIIGSFIVSGLTGGPIGLAINAGITAVEKIAGIDPDRIVHSVLAEVGLAGDDTPAPGTAVSQAAAAAYAGAARLDSRADRA
jgi:hypothetical protein